MLILVLMGTINLPLGHVYSNCLMFYKHFTNGTVFIILCNNMSLMSSSRIALRPEFFLLVHLREIIFRFSVGRKKINRKALNIFRFFLISPENPQ